MSKTISNEKLKARICPICGGTIDVDMEEATAICQYCGVTFDIDVNDEVRKESIKSKTYRKVEEEKIRQARVEEQAREKSQRLKDFKSGNLSKLAVVFVVVAVITVFECFSSGRVMTGILAVVQAVLFIAAILMGMQVISEKRKNLHIVLIIVGLIMIMPITRLGEYEKNLIEEREDARYEQEQAKEGAKREKEEKKAVKPAEKIWKKAGITGIIPLPDNKMAKLANDSEEGKTVEIKNASKDDYDEYYEECKKAGFSIDERYDKYSESTIVFNKDGYRLDIDYDSNDKTIEFELKIPMQLEELEWPNVGFSKRAPEPDSDIGIIEQDETGDFGGFRAYVGKMPMKKYKKYVSDCIDKGFDVEYDRYKYHFSAKDKEKYDIDVEYYGNDIMYISIDNTWVDNDDDDDNNDDGWF